MTRIRVCAAVAVLLAAVAASPAEAATTKVGTLGQVTFAARLSGVNAASAVKLSTWLPSLRSASAIRLESYGGTRAVSRVTATARAAARGAAVKAWLANRGVTARISIANKVWWPGRPGADLGNRLVVVITALKPPVLPTSRTVTVSFTSDYDPPDQGSLPTCNYTPTSAQVSQNAAAVASTARFTAVASGACTWIATLRAVPLNKASTVSVGFLCNDSGDGTPDGDVCFYAAASVTGATVAAVDEVNGQTALAGLTFSATGAGQVALGVKMAP
ncbi:MAG: hypothetical protein KGP01_03665 [Actinomycetales bacterium]|nr:hypothetical protein [Actinomycetales bacterium]